MSFKPSRLVGLSLFVLAACGGGATPAEEKAEATPQPAEPPLRLPHPGEGGMTPALDTRIDDLLEALERDGPTTMKTAKTRALVVYDWANAMALDGQWIHPDLTSLVGLLTQPNYPKFNPKVAAYLNGFLDNLIREMALRRLDKDYFGTIEMETLEPGIVADHLSVSMTHTVGASGVKAGGGYLVPNHFRFVGAGYQTEDPTAPNYVTIRSSNPRAVFETGHWPVMGQYSASLHGGPTPRLFFRLSDGELEEGDTVTVTFGDRTGGSPGMETVQYANSALRYAVWLITADESEGGVLHALPEPAVPLRGGPATGVHGFVDPVAAPGEPIKLTIRAEDRFRNTPSSGVPDSWTLTLNGDPYGRLEADDDHIAEMEISFDTPGVKRFAISSDDGRLQGVADPVLVKAAPENHLYWGETHGHSGWAEGLGLVDAYFAFAREDSRLDFITLSEHDLWMDLGEWAEMYESVNRNHRPGEFLTFMGYEWTVDPPFGGHHNVLFRDPEAAVLASRQKFPTLTEMHAALTDTLSAGDVFAVPHAHMPGDWMTSNAELERLVEIVSYHGTFEWFGRKYLDQGWEVGFIGSSDDHTGSPGYRPRAYGRPGSDNFGGIAAVYAPELTRDAIFDALYDRYAYATNGARIILEAEMDGQRMGTRLPETGAHRLTGQVIGTGEIASITFLKNGEALETLDYTADAEGSLIEVAFEYSSFPGKRAPSIPDPTFQGTLRFENMTATTIETPVADALNSETEGAELTEDGQEIHFSLRSGGRTNTIEISPGAEWPTDAVMTLDLSASLLPQEVGLEPFRVEMKDLNDGPVAFPILSPPLEGRVVIRRTSRPGQMERDFAFEDNGPSVPGDYYFLRVRQIDGGMAWTSPWWTVEPKPKADAK